MLLAFFCTICEVFLLRLGKKYKKTEEHSHLFAVYNNSGNYTFIVCSSSLLIVSYGWLINKERISSVLWFSFYQPYSIKLKSAIMITTDGTSKAKAPLSPNFRNTRRNKYILIIVVI